MNDYLKNKTKEELKNDFCLIPDDSYHDENLLINLKLTRKSEINDFDKKYKFLRKSDDINVYEKINNMI